MIKTSNQCIYIYIYIWDIFSIAFCMFTRGYTFIFDIHVLTSSELPPCQAWLEPMFLATAEVAAFYGAGQRVSR